VNAGAAYPDVVEYMAHWKNRLPHFVEVRSSQPEQIVRGGFPSDVVPVRYTAAGEFFGMKPPFLIQDYLSCCAENVWIPLLVRRGNEWAPLDLQGMITSRRGGTRLGFENWAVQVAKLTIGHYISGPLQGEYVGPKVDCAWRAWQYRTKTQ